ncbi:MAG: ABC transporter substrate-binding protein [Acidobacteriota bacterium]
MGRPGLPRALAGIVTLLLLGCGGAGSADSKKESDAPVSDDTLRIALIAWPATWNPLLSQNAVDEWVFHQVFEGLVDVDANEEFKARLAESWTFSADAKVLTFTLRDGVKWHDGQPFTADDVIFTFNAMKNDADESWRSLTVDVDSVTAPSPGKVVVTYKEPFAAALSMWTVPILPKHCFPAGKSFADASDPQLFKGIGTGPYRISATTFGDSIALERNPDFKRPAPFFRHVVFKMIQDTTEALKQIADGNLDVTRMRPADWRFNTNPEEWDPILKKTMCPSLGYLYIGWNQDGSNPFFSDLRVRRAMTLLWDGEKMKGERMSGLAAVAFGPFPAQSKYFSPKFTPLPHSIEDGKRELDAAGWIDHDGDGIRDRDGLPFKFKVLTIQGNLITDEIAFDFSDELKENGIQMEYVRVSYPELLARLRKGDFQAYISQWSGDFDPDYIFPLFHGSSDRQAGNYVGYVNPVVDELLLSGRRTTDPAKRVEIYQKLHETIYADHPYLFLFYAPTLWGTSTRLEGVKPFPGGPMLGDPGLLEWRSTRPAKKPVPKAPPGSDSAAKNP